MVLPCPYPAPIPLPDPSPTPSKQYWALAMHPHGEWMPRWACLRSLPCLTGHSRLPRNSREALFLWPEAKNREETGVLPRPWVFGLALAPLPQFQPRPVTGLWWVAAPVAQKSLFPKLTEAGRALLSSLVPKPWQPLKGSSLQSHHPVLDKKNSKSILCSFAKN